MNLPKIQAIAQYDKFIVEVSNILSFCTRSVLVQENTKARKEEW